MDNKSFAVFILTHGRPDDVLTYKTLIRCGYTGEIYLIVDNEDKTIDKYIKNFGIEKIKIFNKKIMAAKIDEGNNFENRKVILHARNASFEIAKEMGLEYFIQLDDDYYEIIYKFVDARGLVLIKDINKMFDKFINYYKKSNITSVAFSQTGDFIGGIDNGKGCYRFNKRKCMNSFFCSTERPFQFIGSMNEDVNTYTTLASRGALFLTIPVIAINQKDTQTQKGGMTDSYLKYGTYVKSFTTVMMNPCSVKVSMMNANHKRLHHSINWDNAVPCIISEKYKKEVVK
jgi:hypothetical protein